MQQKSDPEPAKGQPPSHAETLVMMKTRTFISRLLFTLLFAAFAFAFFYSANLTKQALTKEYNQALELIEQGEYIAAWDILDRIGVTWGNVKETMLSIADEYELALQVQKDEATIATLPDLSYQEQKEVLASMYDKAKSDTLYLECSQKEAYRLYEAKQYYEALGLFLIIPEDMRTDGYEETVLDCMNQISDLLQAD